MMNEEKVYHALVFCEDEFIEVMSILAYTTRNEHIEA